MKIKKILFIFVTGLFLNLGGMEEIEVEEGVNDLLAFKYSLPSISFEEMTNHGNISKHETYNENLRRIVSLGIQEGIDNNKITYQCFICNFYTTQPSLMVRHWTTHTGARPYICLCCGATYKQISHRNQHYREKHQFSKRTKKLIKLQEHSCNSLD